MKKFLSGAFVLAAAAVCAQEPALTIAELVGKLGSANFAERQSATEALKNRADAAPALRAAISSGDLETRRRATKILEHLEVSAAKAKLAELNKAVGSGEVERIIEILAAWHRGVLEEQVWAASRDFWGKVVDLHETKGGKKIAREGLWGRTPIVVAERCVTEKTELKRRRDEPNQRPDPCFVRASEINVVWRPYEPNPLRARFEERDDFFVASGRVRISTLIDRQTTILAGGSSEISGGLNCVILCAGDLILNADLGSSIVIARGNVWLGENPNGCRIVSGKSVIRSRRLSPVDCLISENDLNPLGYIRWSDTPKDKAAPKAK